MNLKPEIQSVYPTAKERCAAVLSEDTDETTNFLNKGSADRNDFRIYYNQIGGKYATVSDMPNQYDSASTHSILEMVEKNRQRYNLVLVHKLLNR